MFFVHGRGVGGLPALATLEPVGDLADFVFGGEEERIPTKVWVGMVDAFFHPGIDFCMADFSPDGLHTIIFYRGALANR